MSSLPARQAGEVDMQERRMMSVRVMEEAGEVVRGWRERSLWRSACVLREAYRVSAGGRVGRVWIWWWAVWMSGMRSVRIPMSESGSRGLLLVVRVMKPMAIEGVVLGFVECELEVETDKGE